MLRMADDAQLVIGVAGRIGSGKSEVAQCLRDRFGFQYLRYSLVLAEWYHADPAAKPQLQELGWNVMSGDGQRELNRRLIAQIDPKRDCAVDGLRHPIDYESLRRRIFFSLFSHLRRYSFRGSFRAAQRSLRLISGFRGRRFPSSGVQNRYAHPARVGSVAGHTANRATRRRDEKISPGVSVRREACERLGCGWRPVRLGGQG